MEDKDKILLSAYLDGDLEKNEMSYVEDLLEKDSQALSYLNTLKSVNSGVENHYLESLNSEAAKDAFKDITDLQTKTLPISTKVKNFFSPKIIFTNLATLSLAFVGLSYFNQANINYSLDGFDNQSLETYLLEKVRSSDSTLFENEVKDIISSMVEKKTANSILKFGSESFLISIEKIAYSKEGSTLCYEGKIFSDSEQLFIYCKNETKDSILITN